MKKVWGCGLIVLLLFAVPGLVLDQDALAEENDMIEQEVDFGLFSGPISGRFGIVAIVSNVSLVAGQDSGLYIEVSPKSAYLSFEILGYPFDVPITETPLGTYSHRFTGFSIPFIGDITIYVDISGFLSLALNRTQLEEMVIIEPLDLEWYDWGLKVATCRIEEDAYGSDFIGELNLTFEYKATVGVSADVPFVGRITIGQVQLTSLQGQPSLHPHIQVRLRPSPVALSIQSLSAHEAVLKWERSSDAGFSFYEIEVDGGKTSHVVRIRNQDRIGLLLSVSPDSDYAFTITVEDIDFLKSPERSIFARTPPDPPPEPVNLTYPHGPDLSATSFTIRWNYTHIDDFGRYEVILNGETLSIIRDESHNWSTFYGLRPGTTYTVSTVTYDEWENHATSDTIQIITPSDTTSISPQGEGALSGIDWALILIVGFVGGLLSYPIVALVQGLRRGQKNIRVKGQKDSD